MDEFDVCWLVESVKWNWNDMEIGRLSKMEAISKLVVILPRPLCRGRINHIWSLQRGNAIANK